MQVVPVEGDSVAELERKAGVLTENALELVGRVMNADFRDMFDENGNVLPVGKWGDRFHGALSGLEITEKSIQVAEGNAPIIETKYKVKIPDKLAAAEKVLRYQGAYEREHQQKVDGLTQVIQAIQGKGSRILDTSNAEDAVMVAPGADGIREAAAAVAVQDMIG